MQIYASTIISLERRRNATSVNASKARRAIIQKSIMIDFILQEIT